MVRGAWVLEAPARPVSMFYFFPFFLYLSFLPFLIFGNSFRTRSISLWVQRWTVMPPVVMVLGAGTFLAAM